MILDAQGNPLKPPPSTTAAAGCSACGAPEKEVATLKGFGGDYRRICQKCGHEFETFQSMSADALTVCPADLCGRKRWGKGKVKRTIGAGAGLLFKGSGFYITDYRSADYKAKAKADFPDFYDNVVLSARLENGMQASIMGAQGVQYGYLHR